MLTTLVPVTVLLIAVALVGVFGFMCLTQTLIEERDSELQGDRLGLPVAHVRVGESGFALQGTDWVLIPSLFGYFDGCQKPHQGV